MFIYYSSSSYIVFVCWVVHVEITLCGEVFTFPYQEFCRLSCDALQTTTVLCPEGEVIVQTQALDLNKIIMN